FVIGRAKTTTDLTLPEADVSRHHSVIELSGGSFWLVDMGSTNGPIIKGKRVPRHELCDGDEFLIAAGLIRHDPDPPNTLHAPPRSLPAAAGRPPGRRCRTR